jgi:acyl carrier protein
MQSSMENSATSAGDDVERRVLAVIARAMDCPVSQVTPASTLEGDLGAQSLDYLDIAFSLEREFHIQFPRDDFLQRAGKHFGEENLVQDGVITELGLNLLAKGMPEVDPAKLTSGLKVLELRRMFVVGTFVRVVKQLLQAKAEMDRSCANCRTEMVESSSLPEFVCPACNAVVPLPSGNEVLFQHLLGVQKAASTSAADEQRGD